MKPLQLLSLLVLVLLSACEFNHDTPDVSSREKGLYIIGLKQSLTYEFTSPNGRVLSDSDQVTNLAVYILEAEGGIVYEQHYYPYYSGQVPDTIFIPDLGAGDYELVATTSDYYAYNYYYEDGTMYDTMDVFTDLILPGHAISEGPIYVGYNTFTIADEAVMVNVDMENVSAKITFRLKGGQSLNDAGVELGLYANEVMGYNLRTGEFQEEQYDNYVYNWVDQWSTSRAVYVMPQTLYQINMNYYQYYSGSNFSQSQDLEDPLKLRTGDAITFTLDLDALLEGAGNGVFNFSDIDWNDLGEVTVP